MSVETGRDRTDALTAGSFEPADSLTVHGLEVLKVVADPRRKLVLDLLRREAATVKELAPAVGMPAKSLYYHIRLLEKHGLIRVVDTRLVFGILEKRYRATAHLFIFDELDFHDGVTSPRTVAEGVSTIFSITADDILAGVNSGTIETDDGAPVTKRLLFAWSLISLSPQQREELEQRLETLFLEYSDESERPENGADYRFLVTMFPSFRGAERPDLPALSRPEESAR